ncbi:MAG: phytanoyl-CoA dioxygenase family protein [Opitutaceae bacterium]|nr:phytanoyl-CoA dioxygenase family protein [Opitutaceae bacterium]
MFEILLPQKSDAILFYFPYDGTMTLPLSSFTLSDADITKALSQGFLVIPDVCPKDELTRLQDEYDQLFAEQRGKEEGLFFDLGGTDEDSKQRSLPQLLNPTKYMPWLTESQYMKNCESITQQVLQKKEPAAFQSSHAILKPGKYGNTTPWHQDKSYWGYGSKRQKVNFRMPLEDATVEGGCLWYIPSSYGIEGQDGLDVLEHQPINNDPRIHGLELTQKGMGAVKIEEAVPAETPAGGVVIHFPYSLHYAGPNKTDIDRRAFIISCGYPEIPIHEEKRYPWQLRQKTLRMERAEKNLSEKQ